MEVLKVGDFVFKFNINDKFCVGQKREIHLRDTVPFLSRFKHPNGPCTSLFNGPFTVFLFSVPLQTVDKKPKS